MADRVIIVDVKRANEELNARDVKQMMGRAGRVHGTEVAHAHIFMPSSQVDQWQKKLNDAGSYEVKSHLGDPLTLSFHAISHVVRGVIKDKETYDAWYSRTLDALQRKKREKALPSYEEVAKELHDNGVAYFDQKSGKIEPRPLGRVCTSFYFSPQDVHDWFLNLSTFVDKNLHDNDAAQAWLLANVTSAGGWESDVVRVEADKVREQLGNVNLRRGAGSRLLATHWALCGRNPPCEMPEFYSVKGDLPRVIGAVEAVADCARSLWGKQSSLFEKLRLRLKYGVGSRLTGLVKLPGIGKTTSNELFEGFDVTDEESLKKNWDRIVANGSPSVKRALTKYANKDESTKEEAVQSSHKQLPVGDEFV